MSEIREDRPNSAEDGGELTRQAKICRDGGSPFTANVLEAAKRQLHRAPLTAARIRDWPGNRGHAAVALRLAGGLHALARKQVSTELSRLYQGLDGDFDDIIGMTLAAHDRFLHDWLDSPPKTNEVGRAAAIMAMMLVAADHYPLPFELLELGSSAGLNLNMRLYGYDLGGVLAGDPDSPVRLHPDWRGPPPPASHVEIVSTRGVEIDPIDLTDHDARERLMAYVWAERRERMERLEAAIAIAATHPPAMERGDAVSWIERELARPQMPGTIRAVFHSIVLQYIPDSGKQRIAAAISTAGSRATPDMPLAWASYEWDEDRKAVQLELTLWPDGRKIRLGTSHAHAQWIEWTGETA